MGSMGLQESLSVAKMKKGEVLWLKYVQWIKVQRDTFEKVKHSLNLIYDEHFLLRSKTRYSESDKLDKSRNYIIEMPFTFSHFSCRGRTRERFS